MKRKMSARTEQILSFLAAGGFADAELHPLAGDASFRRYIRIRKGNKCAMLMDAPPEKENSRSYLNVAQYLYGLGYSVPNVLAHDLSLGLLLLEDLGDDLFSAVLRRDSAVENELYINAVDILVEWRNLGSRSALQSLQPYDYKLLMQEVRLFSSWFLPQIVGKDEAARLGVEYLDIWARILQSATPAVNCFVHRDYHADNLMWLPARSGLKRVGMLDFQDAVYGDPAYDMVSLLEDARRDVSDDLAVAMIDRYVAGAGIDKQAFLASYALLGAQRNSKIVGIFSRLAARDGKQHYLNFLPRVWRYLEKDLAHPTLAELKRWIDEHVAAADRGVITIQHDSHDLALSA